MVLFFFSEEPKELLGERIKNFIVQHPGVPENGQAEKRGAFAQLAGLPQRHPWLMRF